MFGLLFLTGQHNSQKGRPKVKQGITSNHTLSHYLQLIGTGLQGLLCSSNEQLPPATTRYFSLFSASMMAQPWPLRPMVKGGKTSSSAALPDPSLKTILQTSLWQLQQKQWSGSGMCKIEKRQNLEYRNFDIGKINFSLASRNLISFWSKFL